MAYLFLFLIAFISICPVMGDIPDTVLDSGIYEVMEHNGDDHLIDVSFSEADSITRCFGYTVTGNSTDFWVLTIDYSGVTIDRQVLNIQHDTPGDWISGVFLESGLLLIIDGESTLGALTDFLLVDLLNPGNSSHSVLQAEVASDEIISLLSLEKFSDGELLAVGTRWSPENSHTLLVMKLDYKGTVLWETPIVENCESQFIRASLEMMSDGGCIATYNLDCFPSSLIPIFRLGSDGQILWHKSLQVNSEFVAGISGFLELGDGRILCTGTVDDMGQMAFRGFSV